jgi:transposase InsO family protein
VRERYLLMRSERGNHAVTMMARLLHVSASGFYSWLGRGEPDDPWAPLEAEVERIWLESRRRFGARSILHSLPPEFAGATLYRVRKIMRGLGMRGVRKNCGKRTTIPDERAATRPDLVGRDFTSPVPTCKLVGDITYLRTGEGWLYLATVIDLCTRMVVGWAISEQMTADIVVSALEMAWGRGYVAWGAIFHSDRGSQYTSRLLARWADARGVRLSVGRTGSCHDNAVAESFFSCLKGDMYDLRKWPTRSEARFAVVEFIEAYYNRAKPHSSVGWRIPAQLMDEFFERTASAEGVRLAA